MSNRLQNVIKGKLERPSLVCIYGQEGVGKTTFAADAPNPIFLDQEDGSAHVDVARMPNINSWDDANEAVDELIKIQHEYKTLVIDSLDWLERLMHQKLCGSTYDVIQNVAGGYGKGQIKAMNTWEPFLSKLRHVRAKGMNVILVCHAEVITFNDPDAIAPYDRFQLKLEKKSAALIREFVDDLLFARFETMVTKEKNEKKGKAFGDGKRVMFTEHRPAFDAKSRNNLPFEMPVSWSNYCQAISKSEDPSKVVAEINELGLKLDAEKSSKMLEAMKKAGSDVFSLVKIRNHARVLVDQQSNKGE